MLINLALLQENQRTLISIHNIVFILFILSNSFKAGIHAGLLMINGIRVDLQSSPVMPDEATESKGSDGRYSLERIDNEKRQSPLVEGKQAIFVNQLDFNVEAVLMIPRSRGCKTTEDGKNGVVNIAVVLGVTVRVRLANLDEVPECCQCNYRGTGN
jgi:hypothetical protein